MAPFMREGLEQGDTVFAATTQRNLEALREELGDDAERMQLEDTTEWATQPYERLQRFRALVDAVPPGRALRALGEPVWEGSDAVVRQWARYESIINLALAGAPMKFICLYDGSSLPPHIVDYASHTHPACVRDGEAVPSETFVAPEEFGPAGSPPDPPVRALELPLDGSELRHTLFAFALEHGLPRRRAEDFMIAANEIATNALIHGGGPTRALLWEERDGELVCRIEDAGPGLADPLAGWLPPEDPRNGGWGLALTRQLCDAMEIVLNGSGTSVWLHLGREAA